jgi:hypothetical protein
VFQLCDIECLFKIHSKNGQTGSSITTHRFETLGTIQTLALGDDTINHFRQIEMKKES